MGTQVFSRCRNVFPLEGVIWQRLTVFVNGKPLLAGNGHALHRRLNAVDK